MKTMQKKGVLAALFITLALPAAAHTTRSRPASGVVESLNTATRTMVFTPATGKVPRHLVVTRQTKFIHDWQFTAAGEVKPGTKAMIYYRTPFFGKPFITKVVWSNGG